MNQRVTLPTICRMVGISDVTGRRLTEDYNPDSLRAPRGWNIFSEEEVPAVVAHIRSKRKRRCRNRYNSTILHEKD